MDELFRENVKDSAQRYGAQRELKQTKTRGEEKENEADAGWRRTVTLPTAGFVTSYFPGDTPCPDNTHTTKDNPVLIDVRLGGFATTAARHARTQARPSATIPRACASCGSNAMLEPRRSRLWRKRGKNGGGNACTAAYFRRVKSSAVRQPEFGISCVAAVESSGTIMTLRVAN